MDLWRTLGFVSIVLALAGWAVAWRGGRRRWPPPGSGGAVAPGVAIGFANLGLLGILIGHDGASRAFSTGMHTLFRDHPGAVVATTALAVVLGAIAGRQLTSTADVHRLVGGVLLADVVAALLVDVTVGEITAIFLPWSIVVESIFGTQLLAAGLGAVAGLAMSRRKALT